MDTMIQLLAGSFVLGASTMLAYRLLNRPARAKARPLLRRAR
jgi:hypothetical protein